MLIGELATRTGVSAKALRFYEEQGLLAPPARTPNGYRSYDDDALDRIAFIRSAQCAGLTLAEIRDVIAIRERGVSPCGHVLQLLDDKARAVTHQIAELRALKRDLDRLRTRAEATDPAECDPRSVCQVLTAGPATR